MLPHFEGLQCRGRTGARQERGEVDPDKVPVLKGEVQTARERTQKVGKREVRRKTPERKWTEGPVIKRKYG